MVNFFVFEDPIPAKKYRKQKLFLKMWKYCHNFPALHKIRNVFLSVRCYAFVTYVEGCLVENLVRNADWPITISTDADNAVAYISSKP